MAKRFAFKPSIWISLATVLFVALTISLGNWQRGRAEHKRATQAQLDRSAAEPPRSIPTEPVDPQRFVLSKVVARGTYDTSRTILIDNKVYEGRVGYHVATPLRLEGSDMHVLVLRGWIAGEATRDRLPKFETPGGEVKIEGVAAVPSDRIFELKSETAPGKVWQNLVLERYAKWSGLKLQPVVIEQTNDAGDGLMRDWPKPDLGIEKNISYSMQWYLFAALAVILYVALNLKRIEDGRPDA